MKTQHEIEQMKIETQKKVWEYLELIAQDTRGNIKLSSYDKQRYQEEATKLTNQYIALCEVLR